EKPSASAISAQLNRVSYVRITRLLTSTARMRNGAIARRPHLLGVFPKIARSNIKLARLPGLGPHVELGRRERDVERSLLRIESDHVAVAQATGGQRLIGGTDHILVSVPRHAL